MGALTHKTNYVIEGLARNLEQFKGKLRFEAILRSWILEIQALEDAAWAVYEARLLQLIFASGSSFDDLLDKLGGIVGQPREGFTNDIYIRLIAARIKTNRSNGRREILLAIMQLITPSTFVEAREYSGAIVLTVYGPVVVPAPVIAFEFLALAVSGGIRGTLVWEGTPNANTLMFGYKFGGGTRITQPTIAQSPGYHSTGSGSGFYIEGGEAAGAFTQDGGSTK